MVKNLVCVADNFILGGIESYYIRMFKWAKKNDYKLFLIYDGDFAEPWEETLKSNEVNTYRMKSIGLKPKIVKTIDAGTNIENIEGDITVIVPSYGKYFQMRRVIQKSAKFILYVLHPDDAIISQNFNMINIMKTSINYSLNYSKHG